MERKKQRSFKVYESSISTSNGYQSKGYRSVPQIRMQGKWLEELGFETESEINVECIDGKLVIIKRENKTV